MAAYRASGATNNTTGTTLVLNEPASGADGELMVATIVMDDSTGFARTGWAVVSTPVVAGAKDYDFVVAYRLRSGSASGTFGWTNSGFAIGSMHAFNGQHASTAVESVTAGTAVADTDKVAPSVSSTYDNSLLVDFCCEDNFGNWTPDAAFTERDDDGGYPGSGILVATLQLSAAGATGTHTHVSAGSDAGIAVRMVIVDDSPTGGGGGGLLIPVVMNQYRQRVA